MAKVNKIITSLGFVALLSILTVIGSAQPMLPPEDAVEPDLPSDLGPPHEGRMHRERVPPMGVPVEMILGGGGFALQDNESHLLRLSIVRLSPLETGRVMDLLISNKSIEEIREAVMAEEGEALYRGSMRLDDIVYTLMNIELNPPGNNHIIVNADIAIPGSDFKNQTEMVGHLSIAVSPPKGGRIGEGQLDIDSEDHRGNYQVLRNVAKHNSMPFEGIRNW